MSKLNTIENTKTKLQIITPCFFEKKGLELVPLPYILHDFLKKYTSLYIILTQQISLSGCIYVSGYWAVYGIVIPCLSGCVIIKY